ncbi:MAG: hypothetical protein AAGD43_06715 [Pseudomonadota bacterium]
MAARRQYIPLSERYAAVLSLLLPDDVKADLIKRRATWRDVERAYKKLGQVDHNVTVRTDSSKRQKRWFNLNYLTIAQHKAKTAQDAKDHAKMDRFARLHLTGDKRTPAQKKRHRPIPSRKFANREQRQMLRARYGEKT